MEYMDAPGTPDGFSLKEKLGGSASPWFVILITRREILCSTPLPGKRR